MSKGKYQILVKDYAEIENAEPLKHIDDATKIIMRGESIMKGMFLSSFYATRKQTYIYFIVAIIAAGYFNLICFYEFGNGWGYVNHTHY